jgi:hypothetical protein
MMNADKTAHQGRQAWLNIKVGLAMILLIGLFFLMPNAEQTVRENATMQAEKLLSADSAQQNLLLFVSESGMSVTMTEKSIDWIDLVIKPLLVEIGGVVLCQVIGLPVMSIVSKVLWRSRRLHWLPYLRKMHLWSKMASRVAKRTSKASRILRRVQKAATRLYKKRSRLCIASEYTNLIGNGSSMEAGEGRA